jgi:hypothetical protein
MEDAAKLEIIESHRPALESEKYRAELDLKLAEKSADAETLAEEPKRRLQEVEDKLKLLDEEAAGIS